MYEAKQDAIFKDFIKLGVKLVESYEMKETEASDPEVKDLVKDELEGDICIKEKEVVEVKDEVITDQNLNLSQVKDSPHDQKEKRNHQKKSKKKREKRKERLLKFHQKLVDVSGLPPSRIMQEMQTPRLSSAMVGLQRRKLEFEESAIPKVPEPKVDMTNHYDGAGAADTSRIQTSQLLFSSPQPPLINGCESTWVPRGSWSEARPCLDVGIGVHGGDGGWSEARPWVQQCGYQWSNTQQGLGTGISSSHLQQPMLYSSHQPCCGWSPPVCQTQPSLPPGGSSPAYCSSCLVFGKVFTVSPV